MTRGATAAVAVWIAACAVGVAALVAPVASPSPIPEAFVERAEVRAPAPDLALRGAARTRDLAVAPPWKRGSADDGAPVLTRRGHRPRPHGAFAFDGTDDGWTRWVPATGSAQASPPQAALSELLPRARVEIVRPDGSVRVCDRWVFGRWMCGPDPWNYVGPATVVARGGQQHCTWAHPTDEGTLRIVLTGVPRGTALSGRHMLADVAADSPVEGDVILTLSVNGEELTQRRQGRRRGVETFRLSIPDGDGPIDVVAEISGDTVAQRHFCFDLQVRGTHREEP